MSLESKLERWQQAGVIDADTRARIEAFERANEKPLLLYTLGALGAVTVAIGIVSIVAANWDGIGKGVKLSLDLLLGAGLAAGLYASVTRQRHWATEVLTGIYYGFAIASLALIGQIYQLGSPTHHALLAWSLSTLPVMHLARTPLLALVWLSGLLWTQIDTSAFYLDRLHEHSRYDDALLGNMVASEIVLSFAAYLLAARIPWLVRERPAVSAAWTNTVWTLLWLGGVSLGFLFYVEIDRSDVLTWSLAVVLVVLGGLIAALPRLYPVLGPRSVLGLRVLLGAIGAVFVLGTAIAREELQAIGAIAQVLILAVAAWTALQLGRVRLFNMITGLIALRVLVTYFEVFGSMLDTGVGMISGGLLTLLLAWVWKRKSPELAARFAAGGHDHAA